MLVGCARLASGVSVKLKQFKTVDQKLLFAVAWIRDGPDRLGQVGRYGTIKQQQEGSSLRLTKYGRTLIAFSEKIITISRKSDQSRGRISLAVFLVSSYSALSFAFSASTRQYA